VCVCVILVDVNIHPFILMRIYTAHFHVYTVRKMEREGGGQRAKMCVCVCVYAGVYRGFTLFVMSRCETGKYPIRKR